MTIRFTDVPYSDKFANRRHLNWITLALMYGGYYMCRYSLPIANKSLCDHFHWSNEDIGWIITATFWAYALGQLINGFLTDRIGGRRSILIGAAGTVILNILFGFGKEVGLLSYFIIIWLLNGYFQAFGAPSTIKISSNWFSLKERGIFTGIFACGIEIGRWCVYALGGYIIIHYSWQWVFWMPALITVILAVAGYFFIVNNPEDLGFPPVEQPDSREMEDNSPLEIKELFKKVILNKNIWIIASAYFCTGVVRHGFEQWYVKYLQEVHQIKTDELLFQITVLAIPFCSVIGATIAGYFSDRVSGGRRGPIACIMYFSQVVLLILFTHVSNPIINCVLLTILSIMISGPHALLGAAAAMDFGGRRASGFAGGLIDSWQYIGAGLTGFGIGMILDRTGWDGWLTGLIVFAFIGGILMALIWNSLPEKNN